MAEPDNNHVMTTDEEIDHLEVGDMMADITGAIVRVDEPRLRANVTRATNQPYRCVLSNRSGRSLRDLFWGWRIAEFEGRIVRQVIRITRGRVSEANPLYRRAGDNLMRIEIFVQSQTTVSILGPIPQANVQPTEYVPINFDQVAGFTGHVEITGYIKLQFASVIANNLTYGSGVITDAVRYRLPVYVTSFDSNLNPALGAHVAIRGQLRRNDNQSLILQVVDMTHVTVVDDTVFSEAHMRPGFRVPGRLLTVAPAAVPAVVLAAVPTAVPAAVPAAVPVAVPAVVPAPTSTVESTHTSAVLPAPPTLSIPERRTVSHPHKPGADEKGMGRSTQRCRLDLEGNIPAEDQQTERTGGPDIIEMEEVIQGGSGRSL